MAVLAPSLVVFRAEVNARWPQRDKASDGWIGDAAHQARVSDHNPDQYGIVRAFDTDEDLDGDTADGGSDAWDIAERLRLSRDPRIKYVIYEGRMFSSYATSGYLPWMWRPYSGTNAHRKHVHVSILPSMEAANNTRAWFPEWVDLTVIVPRPPAPTPEGTCTVNLRVLRTGSKGGDVRSLQALLNAKTGSALRVDGEFGPATTRAVLNVQRFFGLAADGIVGSHTWGALFV